MKKFFELELFRNKQSFCGKNKSKTKRRFFIMEANRHIGCNVNNCAYHCKDCNCCSLDHIEVGSHETNPTKAECTDCRSFKYKGWFFPAFGGLLIIFWKFVLQEEYRIFWYSRKHAEKRNKALSLWAPRAQAPVLGLFPEYFRAQALEILCSKLPQPLEKPPSVPCLL